MVIVTDGQVAGEDALLRQLASASSDTMPRVFTVGIDQAVNAGFLRRLADFGGGDCKLVESEQRLDEAMDSIHRLIGTPALTQLDIEPMDFDWVADSISPSRLPDLFTDRPITIFGRCLAESRPIKLRLKGKDANGNPWQQEISATPSIDNSLLNLWGRARVRDLEDIYASGQVSDRKSLMQQIVDVSLESNVLSRFTAYVAVDKSEIVNQGGVQNEITQPVEMPEGWNEDDSMSVQACYAAAPTAATAARMLFKSGPSSSWQMMGPSVLKRKSRSGDNLSAETKTIEEHMELIRNLISKLSGLWTPFGTSLRIKLAEHLRALVELLIKESHPSAQKLGALASRYEQSLLPAARASATEPLSAILTEISDALDKLSDPKSEKERNEEFWT